MSSPSIETAVDVANSPLTDTANVRETRRISTSKLVGQWQSSFGIDISDEFAGIDEIIEYRCLDTDLLFFRPFGIDGSEDLYRQLGKLPWYYMEEKWEHRKVFPMLDATTRFLEIGCGRGEFLSRAAELGATAGVGIDLNREAIAEGRVLGRPVECANLLDFADQHTEAFDLVCAFQVLEHVPEPRSFLEAAIRLTRPGGRLLFSVPNADSLLGQDTSNLLDMPPHHISRWGNAAFKSLPRFLPVHLEFLRNEPLAIYHADWYLRRRFSTHRRLPAVMRRSFDASSRMLLKQSATIRRRLSGHTHIACFRKTAG